MVTKPSEEAQEFRRCGAMYSTIRFDASPPLSTMRVMHKSTRQHDATSPTEKADTASSGY